ncbi:MAG: hypothetical protein ABJH07_08160 [Sedimentitalea sp.]|uniref:hypothetical protein n=1 Tax=Sedimentitalea sp. TaxID=2048915 RepID=UPI003265F851
MQIEIPGELTHVSTVQTWECDSNAHLNVQFYHQRFREAGHYYRRKYGLEGASMTCAHTRFYRELHADHTGRILTLPVYDIHGAYYLMHNLTVDGMTPSCISLDRLERDADEVFRQAKHKIARPLAEFSKAGPRGLGVDHRPPSTKVAAMLATASADISCMTHVLQHDLDHAGVWRAERLISSFSNGGQSAWALVGATENWLRARNLGRVVLELKYKQIASPEPDTILRQISYPFALKGKTYSFCHQIEDAVSGQVYGLGELLSALMDLTSRKVVSIPDELTLPKGVEF